MSIGRGPITGSSRVAIGAMIIVAIGRGSVASPAGNAPIPSTNCRWKVRYIVAPIMMAPATPWMRNAPPRTRSATIRNGSSGCATRLSIQTKTASRTTPSTRN